MQIEKNVLKALNAPTNDRAYLLADLAHANNKSIQTVSKWLATNDDQLLKVYNLIILHKYFIKFYPKSSKQWISILDNPILLDYK